MSQFGFHTTADEVLEGLDLTGRRFLITGGYSGLGRETARALAAKGAHVILSGRDAGKLAEAAGSIGAETGATLETLVCDLASLASVRAAGEEARERFAAIDVLINNAGVMATPEGRTADGFETQFGTNHLGHFLLTRKLMPLLEKGNAPRIVNLSSRAHDRSGVDFDDPFFERRDYDKWVSYGQSKTANILFSVGLEKRFGPRGIHAIAVHPGGIQTNLARHMDDEDRAIIKARMAKQADEDPEAAAMAWKTIPQGAATSVWAATAPALEGEGGFYAEDCHRAPVTDAGTDGGVRPYAVDPDLADRLWALSERMVGGRFAA